MQEAKYRNQFCQSPSCDFSNTVFTDWHLQPAALLVSLRLQKIRLGKTKKQCLWEKRIVQCYMTYFMFCWPCIIVYQYSETVCSVDRAS
jgi:hypothetical protein